MTHPNPTRDERREAIREVGYNAPLPEHYQWGADAMESYDFGRKQATDAILEALSPGEGGGEPGRIVLTADDPLALALRPSPETIAEIAKIEEGHATALHAARNFVVGAALHLKAAEGWRLVPVEPTEAMLASGALARAGGPVADERVNARFVETYHEEVDGIWEAMLAASPPSGLKPSLEEEE